MKNLALISVIAIFGTACVATPEAVSPGPYTSETGMTVNLDESWSMWAESINLQTKGEYLTKDGLLLNRLHMVSLEDGDPLLKVRANADIPTFSSSSSELELVDFVTASLLNIGYTQMKADNIRPYQADGQGGLRFDLSGSWENGLKVRGDAAAFVVEDMLKLVFFLAPTMHYYGQSAQEVDRILSSLDFAE